MLIFAACLLLWGVLFVTFSMVVLFELFVSVCFGVLVICCFVGFGDMMFISPLDACVGLGALASWGVFRVSILFALIAL